jgi:dipeptidyl-peptidase-3
MAEPQYLAFTGAPVGNLRTDRVLATLTPEQIKYATYLALAAWAGFPILLSQVSVESPAIHAFLSAFIGAYPADALEAATAAPDTPLFYLLEYAAQFYYNGGNYLGFGDRKFIPRVARTDLAGLLTPYPAVSALFESAADAIYSVDPSVLALGWPPKNVTAYYSPGDFSEAEQTAIDALLAQAKIHVNNTVVIREPTRYNVRVLSIVVDDTGVNLGEYNGLPIVVTKGWHSATLQKVNHWLSLAREAALSPIEAEALGQLIAHNETGDVLTHIAYSDSWVKDDAPTVESYIGVIENYRDPSGVRCEWEGFVAAVDPEESRFLHLFVEKSAAILPLLPYPRVYERPAFVPPSYNAINILTFCVSGMPVGINIPNYDEIRLTRGFKNVSLSNVLAASTPSRFHFLPDEVIAEFLEDYIGARKLGIACHELYGHGSGALLTQADIAKGVPDLLNPGRQVRTFWAEGETFQPVFGQLGPSYEEARAEATALHLAFKDEVLELFGIPPERRLRFKVNSVRMMLHNSIAQLTCYAPAVSQWKQAHARARFAILRAVLIWGRGAVTVRKVDGQFKLFIDAEKFDGVIDAIEKLLVHLNYYKAVRLPEQAKEFYGALTSLDDFWLEVRVQALAIQLPRSLQCGATIVKSQEGDLTLVGPTKDALTTLDVVRSLVQNIKIASE